MYNLNYSLFEKLADAIRASRVEYQNLLAVSIGAFGQEIIIPDRTEGIFESINTQIDAKAWFNRIFNGDNLPVMLTLLAGSPEMGLPSLRNQIDLIYIDPPFNTLRSYAATIKLAVGSIKQTAYSDIWQEDIIGYLRMIYIRLALMRDLLSETGSIMVHLDWHVSHYVKILLDDIFGPEHFRNEIIWCYGGGGAPKRHYPRKHDIIFWYSKGDQWTFNKQFRPYSPGTLQRGLTAVKGPKYQLHSQGAGLDDWWADREVQKILSPTAYENYKYSTQKPLGLLQRIIKGHSNEGDLVADFFAGTGTCGEAAERLGRRWILADMGKPANLIMRKRLAAHCKQPFIINTFSETKVKTAGRAEDSAVLSIENIERIPFTNELEKIFIELKEYNCPAANLNIPQQDLEKLREFQNNESLNLIDFWSIDPDYDGSVFKSCWYSFRDRSNRDKKRPGNTPSFTEKAELLVRQKKGSRTIAIKAVDIFGQETISIWSL